MRFGQACIVLPGCLPVLDFRAAQRTAPGYGLQYFFPAYQLLNSPTAARQFFFDLLQLQRPRPLPQQRFSPDRRVQMTDRFLAIEHTISRQRYFVARVILQAVTFHHAP